MSAMRYLIRRIAADIPDTADLDDYDDVEHHLRLAGWAPHEYEHILDNIVGKARKTRRREQAACAVGLAMIVAAVWFIVVATSGPAYAG